MKFSRRKFLSIVGGGIVVAAAGTSWAVTRDPAAARLPWTLAGSATEADPRRRAISYAILAPNPHNRQPWIADLSVDGEIMLYCDLDRRLPHTDPFDRQITVGFGCFLELLVLAAAADGFHAKVDLFPWGEPHPRLDGRPLARIQFQTRTPVSSSPLFDHVLARRSNKQPYDTSRTVSEGDLFTVAQNSRSVRVAFTNVSGQVEELRKRAWEAMQVELTTFETMKESVDLMRIGRTEIQANPDGIDIGGAFVEAMATFRLFKKEDLLNPTSAAFLQQIPMIRAPFDTAMAFMWLVTPDNSRRNQIEAGRDYMRLNLAATGLGIAMHPLSQALQEFDEMRPHYNLLRQTLGIKGEETLQMFARLGYGPAVNAGPRWPYETRIRTS